LYKGGLAGQGDVVYFLLRELETKDHSSATFLILSFSALTKDLSVSFLQSFGLFASQSKIQRGDPFSISSKVKIHEEWIGKSGFIKVTVYFYGGDGLAAAVSHFNNI